MDLIINGSTYTLKAVNFSRRKQFVDNVLSYYNYQSESFDSFIKETKEKLQENHNIKMTLPQVKSNFFKQYSKSVLDCIWHFLYPQDKKELKLVSNLDVPKEEITKFIENVSLKIREYSKYVKSSGADGKSEDINSIYAYIARIYGWTFDYMKDLDELTLLKAVEKAIEIQQKEYAQNINSQALAGAYAGGSKRAKTEIDKINNKIKTKVKMDNIKKINPDMKPSNQLSREDIKKMMEAKNG